VNLIGKSRTDIERALRNKDRPELVNLICELATMEPHFSISQVARARKISRTTVLDKVRKREIPWAHRLGEHGLRIPLSAIVQWDKNTRITNGNEESTA
jgi:predicted DNA-binding transcriptional regulator AlpA